MRLSEKQIREIQNKMKKEEKKRITAEAKKMRKENPGLKHMKALDLIAKHRGYQNYNVLAAKLKVIEEV